MKVDLKKLAGNPELAGLHNLPDVVEVPNSHLDEHIRRLNRQHPEGDSETHRVRAIAHYLWTSTDKHRKGELQCAPKAAPDESTVQVHVATQLPVWCRRFAIAVLVLLGLILAATLARAQGTSQIDVITFENSSAANIKTFAAPFRIQCGVNVTCTFQPDSNGNYVMNIGASAGGSVTINGTSFSVGSSGNLGQLNDSNGNPTVKSVATASAVDYLTVTNGAAGSPGEVTLGTNGSDASVALYVQQKGNSNIYLGTTGGQVNFLTANSYYFKASGSGSTNALIINGSGAISTYGEQTTAGLGVAPELYNTSPSASSASISSTTIVSSATASYAYQFQFYLTQAVLGAGCSGNTTIAVNLIYTDPNAASAQTITLGVYTITANGTVGHVPFVASDMIPFTFRSKASQSISFSTTYTEGSGCTTGPTVQLYPVLFEE